MTTTMMMTTDDANIVNDASDAAAGARKLCFDVLSDDAVDEDLLPLLRSALDEASEEGKCKKSKVCDAC